MSSLPFIDLAKAKDLQIVEVVPVTLIPNVWVSVPLSVVQKITDVKLYDQLNRFVIHAEIDVDSLRTSVKVKGNSLVTINVNVEGYKG